MRNAHLAAQDFFFREITYCLKIHFSKVNKLSVRSSNFNECIYYAIINLAKFTQTTHFLVITYNVSIGCSGCLRYASTNRPDWPMAVNSFF